MTADRRVDALPPRHAWESALREILSDALALASLPDTDGVGMNIRPTPDHDWLDVFLNDGRFVVRVAADDLDARAWAIAATRN